MELLIVMVIVTVLVTIAVPKYKATMERGRGMEAINNAQAVSDAVNAHYIQNYTGSYASKEDLCLYAVGSSNCRNVMAGSGMAHVTHSDFFTHPEITIEGGKAIVSLERNGSNEAKKYTIIFVNKDGETAERYCTGNQTYCNVLGASRNRSGGGWSF